MQVDPITVEIIKGALKAAGREMGLLIERTAMSAFIREKKDFFAGMYDAQGHLVYTDHDKFGPGMVDCVMEVYPAAKPNGTAVVVAPGGGFTILAIEHEGRDVARWMNERGVTAFVLRYRLVPTPDRL